MCIRDSSNICSEPHAVPGEFVSLIFNSTAGAALKWYRNAFEESLRETCRQTGENIYRVLDGGLSRDPSPLLFLPHLAGTGTPYMDADAKGMLCGLTLSSTRADIYRAIIEGMNYEMRYNLSLLEALSLIHIWPPHPVHNSVPERLSAPFPQLPGARDNCRLRRGKPW